MNELRCEIILADLMGMEKDGIKSRLTEAGFDLSKDRDIYSWLEYDPDRRVYVQYTN